MNKTAAVVLLCSALTGCGTYSLGRAFPQKGETQDQVRLAVLDCQDKAKNEANTDGRVAASFAAGLTIIGAPIAIAEERRKTREVWQECMKAKGYRVEPPDDGTQAKYAPAGPGKSYENPAPALAADPVAPVAEPPKVATPKVAEANPATSAPVRDATAQLEKLNELRAKGLITDAEYQSKRKAILNSL